MKTFNDSSERLGILNVFKSWRLTLLSILLILITACAQSPSQPVAPETGRIGGGEGKQCLCTADYSPVCGSDGQTYSNGCAAECVGVKWVGGMC